MTTSNRSHRVAVVTGGGGGIGSACALDLARQGATVVVVDPGVGVEGEILNEPTAAQTAQRIRAEGGTAIDSTVSVTDRNALEELFAQLHRDLGPVAILVNAAGIVRFASLLQATEDDWSAVLDVHFTGYLNVLSVALPQMVSAGYGRVVGFTSGVGLARTAGDSMPYGCAKRAVASLTWELGPLLPPGVNVNALSPIAGTRMVRQALVAAGAQRGGVDLTAMPQPEDMAPAATYLSGDRLNWLRGDVLYSAGSELSLISPPRLIEAVRTERVGDFGAALGTLVPVVLEPAEATQHTGGGSNPRLGDVFSATTPVTPASAEPDSTCLIISHDVAVSDAVEAAMRTWNMKVVRSDPPEGFAAVELALAESIAKFGPIDAAVVVTRDEGTHDSSTVLTWDAVLTAHRSTADRVLRHGAWIRALARHAATSGHHIRLVNVVEALTPAGRTAAQAVAQMSRSANALASPVPIDAFSVSVETGDQIDAGPLGSFVARLACTEDGRSLRGAELVAARGWVGLRSHPAPLVTATFGGRDVPSSIDDALRLARLR